jgi:hypothetical protein
MRRFFATNQENSSDSFSDNFADCSSDSDWFSIHNDKAKKFIPKISPPPPSKTSVPADDLDNALHQFIETHAPSQKASARPIEASGCAEVPHSDSTIYILISYVAVVFVILLIICYSHDKLVAQKAISQELNTNMTQSQEVVAKLCTALSRLHTMLDDRLLTKVVIKFVRQRPEVGAWDDELELIVQALEDVKEMKALC